MTNSIADANNIYKIEPTIETNGTTMIATNVIATSASATFATTNETTNTMATDATKTNATTTYHITTTTETIMLNPCISHRLSPDVPRGFLPQYGFSFPLLPPKPNPPNPPLPNGDGGKGGGKGRDGVVGVGVGIGVSVRLDPMVGVNVRSEDGRSPRSSDCSRSRHGGGHHRSSRRCRTKMASLLILVLNIKLAPTVGLLLHTLVRICVDMIDPRRDIAVRVFFDWRCDYGYMTMTTMTTTMTTVTATETNLGEGGGGHCRQRIRIRRQTAMILASVNSVFVNNYDNDVIFFVVASVSPATYLTTFT